MTANAKSWLLYIASSLYWAFAAAVLGFTLTDWRWWLICMPPTVFLFIGRLLARQQMIEQGNADVESRLNSLRSYRGVDWVIRWEEHGGDGPGFYAMHDFWEGGQIGPFATSSKAFVAMAKVLSETGVIKIP